MPKLGKLPPIKPLPENWERGITRKGRVYFINHATKTTTWQDPRSMEPNQEYICKNDLGLLIRVHYLQ
jgi:endothelial cell adhesion protein